jgi:hypothetical protein
MRRWLQLALLVALLAAAALASVRAVARTSAFRRAERACAAADAGDWKACLEATTSPLEPTAAGLRAADCRCVALMQTGRRGECVALLERLLADSRADDWLPRPALTAVAVEERQARGDLVAALQLATRGVDRYATDLPLLLLEATLRLRLEEVGTALDAEARRLPTAGAAGPRLRAFLADHAAARGEPERALTLLGATPPAGPDRGTWHQIRGVALARLGRGRELAELVDAWALSEPARAKAFYGWALSVGELTDPRGRSMLEFLRDGIDAGDALGDRKLLEIVYVRYVSELLTRGRREEALRVFDQGVAKLGSLGSLDRADLARAAGRTASSEGVAADGAVLEIRVAALEPGMELLLSPQPSAPHDTSFERAPLPATGLLRLRRAPGDWPVRWVLRDAGGGVRGSGAAWPATGDTEAVVVTPRPALPPALATAAGERPRGERPRDGRRRLFVVVLDCGDWRFVEHGRARRELPTFEALATTGARAVLTSEPAFTAVAVHSIAKPGAEAVGGVIGVAYRLGDEVAGLNFVGSNPLAPLAWLLPDASDLFTTLGAGQLQTANLLHSFGGMQVGRHGALVGPHGVVGTVALAATRPLRADERTLLRVSADAPATLLEEMAADFDNAARLAAPGGPDLVVLRVASLDILTHANLPAASRAGQDDGDALLFRLYRYMDARLDELWRTLDADDALIVMSDHGIRTALEHDPQALFLAAGPGIRVGRVPGAPALAGIPRLIADSFGVRTDWPATGIERIVASVGAETPTGPAGKARVPAPAP